MDLSEHHELFLREFLPKHDSGIFVTLTYAASLDSRISLGRGLRTQLSGPETKAMTHFLRANHDAILVGANTVLADDPSLNCRYPVPGLSAAEASPQPVVIDPKFRCGISMQSKVMQTAISGTGKPPWVLVSSEWRHAASPSKLETINELERSGARIIPVSGLLGSRNTSWSAILDVLLQNGIKSVMVEGGAEVINDLLKVSIDGLSPVNVIVITVAPLYLGSNGVQVSPSTALDTFTNIRWEQFGRDCVMAGFVKDCL